MCRQIKAHQRASDFAIPKQQLPMLRRDLVTPPRQGKGVSCPAHYRLGCVQPCACPLPQRFSVRAREQIRLVQLRDGLRATPSLDVAARRGVAVLLPERRVGTHDGLASAGVASVVGASLRFLRRERQRFTTSRGSSGWPDHPRRSQNPSCSTLGFSGSTSSERTSVRMVLLVAMNCLKSTCWKLQKRFWRALCSGTCLTCCGLSS